MIPNKHNIGTRHFIAAKFDVMVDYAKYRVSKLKEFLEDRQLPIDGLKATLMRRLTQSDARITSIEEDITRRVELEIASSGHLSRTPNAIAITSSRTLHHAMDSLKSIPGFIPTTAGHMMLSENEKYTSSQNPNPQSILTEDNATKSTIHSSIDAVQFNEDDFSDDDNIDLDTNYALPMTQSTSQPPSQLGVNSKQHMPTPTQNYGMSHLYRGWGTPSQPSAALSNNQVSPLSSFNYHPPGDAKAIFKSEKTTSGGGINYFLPEFSSSRATSQSFTVASSSSANIERTHTEQFQMSQPEAPYLWYYQMEQMYFTGSQNPQSEKEKLARRRWLAKLDIDVSPFYTVQVDQLQRDKVEIHWALKSAETRREIELKAIRLKHAYRRIDEVPLRLAPLALRTPVPIKLIGLVPLPFLKLEQTYFNIRQRSTAAYHDLVSKRLSWLKELGLDDPRYLPLSQTPSEQQAMNKLYDEKPRVERRAIEAKACYINAMLSPPNPSWETFEKAYEIYPASAFTVFTTYSDKRREWLESLGLNIAPFRFKTLELAEGNMQWMEVAWSAMTDVERNHILEKAQAIKENGNPVLRSWSALEESYGFINEKEKEFKNNLAGYVRKRELWLIDIGLNFDPFKNATATTASLQAAWSKRSAEERKTIVEKAKFEKERYVRDLARKKLEKAGDNYKPPPGEAKNRSNRSSTKKSSGNKISKSSSYRNNRHGYGGYSGRSTTSSYRSYQRHGRYGRY